MTPGEDFLKGTLLKSLNRLRRIGSKKMKLASDLTENEVDRIVRRAQEYKRPRYHGTHTSMANAIDRLADKAAASMDNRIADILKSSDLKKRIRAIGVPVGAVKSAAPATMVIAPPKPPVPPKAISAPTSPLSGKPVIPKNIVAGSAFQAMRAKRMRGGLTLSGAQIERLMKMAAGKPAKLDEKMRKAMVRLGLIGAGVTGAGAIALGMKRLFELGNPKIKDTVVVGHKTAAGIAVAAGKGIMSAKGGGGIAGSLKAPAAKAPAPLGSWR